MSVQVSIQDRLKELSKALDIKQVDIAEKTGIDKVTISLYFNGKRIPKQENIRLIADKFNVDPAWLLGYDVPMIRKEVISDSDFSNLLDVINEDAAYFRAGISALKKIPAEKRAIILKMLEAAGE